MTLACTVEAYLDGTDAVVVTVENTTGEMLEEVRVEVHLSNGVELGPTTPRGVSPGETVDIMLSANGEDFARWSAHPEVGRDEHGDETEGGEGREGGEHGGDSD